MKRFGCLAALTLAGMIIMAQTNGTGETVITNFEHAIPNIPGKSLVATVVNYAPGGASASHEQAKSAFIYADVGSGVIESQVNDSPKRVYRAGESSFEEPGSLHRVSRNASKTEPAKLLAIFGCDREAELSTPDTS